MHTLRHGIVISDSLYKLIASKFDECKCCHILYRFIQGESGMYRYGNSRYRYPGGRLVNKELPGNYFTFREREGMISYMPTGKEQVINDDGTWSRKGRQDMKPAKWMKMMLAPRLASRIKDEVFAGFATLVKVEENKQKITFEEVSIMEGYRSSNYDQDAMPESCMWDDPVSGFYKGFDVSCLVSVNGEGGYTGRALVWRDVKASSLPNPIILMDRIYAKTPELQRMFKEHAKTQGWYHKAEQNGSCFRRIINPEGAEVGTTMRVTSKNDLDDVEYYPYCDTFRGIQDCNTLINSEDHDDGVEYTLDETDGDRTACEDEHDGEVQTVRGDWISENSATYIEGHGWVDSEYAVECHRSGNMILLSDSFTVELNMRETVYFHRDYVTEN